MQTLSFLISTLIELYTMVLLLRIWMQWSGCDFYNPFAQFVVKATQRVVAPVRRLLPPFGPIDSASLIIAIILNLFKSAMLLNMIGSTMLLSALPAILLFTLFILLKSVGMLIFWVLIIMAIMSWISQGRNPVEYVLIQLSEPLLRPIRRVLPAMSGIDFSPMLLLLLLYVINMGISELLASYGNLLYISLWKTA